MTTTVHYAQEKIFIYSMDLETNLVPGLPYSFFVSLGTANEIEQSVQEISVTDPCWPVIRQPYNARHDRPGQIFEHGGIEVISLRVPGIPDHTT